MRLRVKLPQTPGSRPSLLGAGAAFLVGLVVLAHLAIPGVASSGPAEAADADPEVIEAGPGAADGRETGESEVGESETEESKDEPSPRLKDLSGREGNVWVIPVEGTIDLGLASFVRRSVEEAVTANAALIVIEVNTFGGRVDAATEIRDALIGSGIPTAAYIRERAWSAGALISLACDSIWMALGSSIGAAEPRPKDEKVVSALRAEFESMAERTQRDPRYAAAMVDINVEIEGVVGDDEILSLTPQEALEVGYAEGVITSRAQLLEPLGLGDNPVHNASLNWGERVARILTAPVVSQILLTLAFLGLIAEVTSPGLGIPGLAGLTALILFFGGRMVVGIVGWEAPLLFLAGVGLLLVELFVIPGFGVAGLGGVGSIFASLYFSFDTAENAVQSIGISMGLTILGTYFIWKYGKRSGMWNRLVLKTRQVENEGYVAPSDFRKYVGHQGRALTALRPAGTVDIGGDRVDAVSEGGYIPADRTVVVVKVEGARVVVREGERS